MLRSIVIRSEAPQEESTMSPYWFSSLHMRPVIALTATATPIVQNDIAEIVQEFGGTVSAARKQEKFRRLVEERSGDLAGAKALVIHYVLEKGNVRFDAADSKFAQRPIHAMASAAEREVPCRYLHQ